MHQVQRNYQQAVETLKQIDKRVKEEAVQQLGEVPADKAERREWRIAQLEISDKYGRMQASFAVSDAELGLYRWAREYWQKTKHYDKVKGALELLCNNHLEFSRKMRQPIIDTLMKAKRLPALDALIDGS